MRSLYGQKVAVVWTKAWHLFHVDAFLVDVGRQCACLLSGLAHDLRMMERKLPRAEHREETMQAQLAFSEPFESEPGTASCQLIMDTLGYLEVMFHVLVG